MITLRNVSKTYTTKTATVQAVKDIELSIDSGEIYGIIGYSGAGKSTLIRLLNGLEKPSSGEVFIGEKDITKLKESELRKIRQKVSMIFQHFNLLWSRTVEENVEFPLEIAGVPKSKRKARAKELIELVGLAGKEQAYPSQLSGGQKQRVGIARALANNPEVLLCDEATSALDPETTDSILELLVDINKRLGLTIVLITHEMHVIRKICHRVAVMEAGEIVESGNVLNVFRSPEKEITKKFVSQISEPEKLDETIPHLLAQFPNGKLVKLVFLGDQAEQPILSKLMKKFAIDVNIVQGSISHTQDGAYGTLFIQLDGDALTVEEAIRFLHEQQIQTEVLTYA